jgi:hypothetical protein
MNLALLFVIALVTGAFAMGWNLYGQHTVHDHGLFRVVLACFFLLAGGLAKYISAFFTGS